MVKDTGHYEHLGDYSEKLYAALGRALDAWGNVEAQLSSIFCAAVRPKEYDVASAAFSAILSFEVQIAVTDAAVREAFSKDRKILDEWKSLSKFLDKLRVRRNRLAHGRTIILRNKETRLHERRFLPFFHYYTHKDWGGFERYTIEDIQSLEKDFSKLASDLNAFGKSIGAKHELRITIYED